MEITKEWFEELLKLADLASYDLDVWIANKSPNKSKSVPMSVNMLIGYASSAKTILKYRS